MNMPVAVFVDQFRPVNGFLVREHDPGPPAPNEIRIAIKAVGISYADVLIIKGQYQVRPDLPFIPGTECAGIVEAVGSEIVGLSEGDYVTGHGWCGMCAEVANLPAHWFRKMPSTLSFEQAAVLSVSFATALYALVNRGSLGSDETLLVLGAGGATGHAAVQIGRHLGAHVIASASSPEKRDLALAGGASAVISSQSSTWREDVRAANNGRPVDVVFDPVGGEATEPAFRSLSWSGRHLVIGFTAGIASVRTNLPLLKGASLIGVDIRQFGIFEPATAEANLNEVFDLAQQGVLRPAIARTYALKDFAVALDDVAKGEPAGRIVLTM
jgi:NADPH:quinone reductase